LRPTQKFADTTVYQDEALHADARYDIAGAPVLSARVRQDLLRKFLKITPRDRLIDLGCGNGRSLLWNRELGAWSVGVDVSSFFSSEVRQVTDLVVSDLRCLPLANASFTKAVSLDVLEHLSRDDLSLMLSETARVLSVGGQFFVYSHVMKNSSLAFGLRVINTFARFLERVGVLDLAHERLRKSDHRNPLADLDDLHRMLRKHRLHVIKIRYYTPLIGAFIENIMVRAGEQFLRRRAKRRSGGQDTARPGALDRAVRTEARLWIEKRGVMYHSLRLVTWFMKLDLLLFGRIKSGPFFALIERMPDPSPSSPGVPAE
tara:strand:+ start:695 stop:1645 length:951 start_codon:yes stop_codon:yes gene_type:complete